MNIHIKYKKISGIYLIRNEVNNKIYVGSANDFYTRCRIHLCLLKKNKHHSPILQNAFNKHGEENFSFEIIENVSDKSKLIDREQNWIDFFNPEYNMCKKAVNSRLGVKVSEETKRKMSIAFKGRKFTEERKQKLRGTRGFKHTQETKDKISLKNKGKVRTKEHSAKIALARKGKPLSEETRKKLLGRKSWNTGIKMSEQARKNMSIAFTGRVLTQEHKDKVSKALKGRIIGDLEKQRRTLSRPKQGTSARIVINKENGIFYDSIKEAWLCYGKKTLTSFGRQVRGKQKGNGVIVYA